MKNLCVVERERAMSIQARTPFISIYIYLARQMD